MRASEGKLQADRFLLLIRESLASRTWATSRGGGWGESFVTEELQM